MLRLNKNDEIDCVFGLPRKCPFSFTPEQLLADEKLLKYCSFCMKAAYATKQVKATELKMSIVNTL